MGIEPTPSAWKAEVLPLNYTRLFTAFLVEGGGFEPPKAEPADLQSAPFGHSGTPPKMNAILRQLCSNVNMFFELIIEIFPLATSSRD
jgi:hypothetical protein